jgi:hypothetical protein
MWHKTGHLVAFCLTAAAAAAAAVAQTSQPEVVATGTSSAAQSLLSDSFMIDVGAFVLQSNVKATLNGAVNSSNQSIDFDQVFGTNADTTRVRADILWRITPRQHLSFMYFNDNVARTRDIAAVQWGDYTFGPGSVTAQTQFDIYEGYYEYAVVRDRDYDVSIGVGVHYDDFKAQLSGQATYTPPPPAPPQQLTAATKTASVPAPLPVIGVRANWAATSHLMIDASGQLLGANYSGINGSWSDIRAGLTWMFSDHFGIGAGYDRFYTNVKVDKTNFTGRAGFGYQGAMIYIKGGF